MSLIFCQGGRDFTLDVCHDPAQKQDDTLFSFFFLTKLVFFMINWRVSLPELK